MFGQGAVVASRRSTRPTPGDCPLGRACGRYSLRSRVGGEVGVAKVFVSSVIVGMERFRGAAAAAVRSLGHEVILAENLTASPDTPQQACLAGVREADVVVP